MKAGIHPRYQECKVSCGCGNEFVTISTTSDLKVEICNACHPFYTGKQKFIDTAGRVQKFEQRFKWSGDSAGEKAKQRSAAAAKRKKEKKPLPKAGAAPRKQKKKEAAPASPAAPATSAVPEANAPAPPPAAGGDAPPAGGDAQS